MERRYNNHILGNQFSLLKFGSTSNAVIGIQNHSSFFNNANYEYARIFSVGLSKAFNRVPHHLIVNNLREIVGLDTYIENFIANLFRKYSVCGIKWKQVSSKGNKSRSSLDLLWAPPTLYSSTNQFGNLEIHSVKLKINSLKKPGYPYLRAAFRNRNESTASDRNSVKRKTEGNETVLAGKHLYDRKPKVFKTSTNINHQTTVTAINRPPKRRHLYIVCLSNSVSTDDIKEYCKNKGDDLLCIREISREDSRLKSL